MHAIRNIFLILPALTIVHHVSDAIPISEWLRVLAANWRALTHSAISTLVDLIPFVPDLAIPPIVLDELSLALLMLVSIVVAYATRRYSAGAIQKTVSEGQVSSRVFWISVVALGAVFFLTYDFAFYRDMLVRSPEDISTSHATLALITASIVWCFIPVLIVSDMGDRQSKFLVAAFCLLLFFSHLQNVIQEVADNPWLWTLFGAAWLLLLATTILLHRYNRNAVPILLSTACALLIADAILRLGEFFITRINAA